MEGTTQTVSQGVCAWGTGRRKTSVARVRILEGSGKISINDKGLEEFFPRERDRGEVLAPLKVTDTINKYNVIVKVEGGGPTGQSGAISLGIARALQKVNGEYVDRLREYGLLTRDSRMKERKKYGQKGARKRFQWTKR